MESSDIDMCPDEIKPAEEPAGSTDRTMIARASQSTASADISAVRAHHRSRTPFGLLIGTGRLPCLSQTNLMVVGVDGSKAKGIAEGGRQGEIGDRGGEVHRRVTGPHVCTQPIMHRCTLLVESESGHCRFSWRGIPPLNVY